MKYIHYIIQRLLSLFDTKALAEQPQKVIDNTPPKRFYSLIVLGDEFFNYHFNIDLNGFVAWIKKNKVSWYKEHADLINKVGQLSLEKLIESIYAKSFGPLESEDFKKFFRKWYVQAHGVFAFPKGYRLFLTLKSGHLLEVLYNIRENEIKDITSETDIAGFITTPTVFKYILFIGADSNGEIEQRIFNVLIPCIKGAGTQYKIINDDIYKASWYISELVKRGFHNFVEATFDRMTTIPTDPTTQARFDRYDQFNDFGISANKRFKAFLNQTPKAKRFDLFYILNVWTNADLNQDEIRFVNVSFGNRIIDVIHQGKNYTATPEEGAGICFNRLDDGFVNISLFPAKTANKHPIEDIIILKSHLDPVKLLDEGYLRKLWEIFISYMECTSLDGDPSFCQTYQILKVRFTKHYIAKNVFKDTRLIVSLKSIAQFVLSVGLSGFILVITQNACSRDSLDSAIKDQMTRYIEHNDSVHSSLKETQDSINMSVKKINDKIKDSTKNSPNRN